MPLRSTDSTKSPNVDRPIGAMSGGNASEMPGIVAPFRGAGAAEPLFPVGGSAQLRAAAGDW